MIKKIPLLPNMITAFGLTCGLFIIFKVNMVDPGEGTYIGLLYACGILLLAALADLLDGAVARAMKAQSEFGGYFDSLSDAITFGVTPPVIMMKSLSVEQGTELSFLVTSGAIVYSLCGVLRLVRYNVASFENKETKAPVEPQTQTQFFTGLPIPAAAAAVVSANLFMFSPDLNANFYIDNDFAAVVLSTASFIIGYFMVSKWPFPSLKNLNIRVASFELVFCLVVVAVFLFYGIMNRFALTFFLITWGYIIGSCLFAVYRYILGSKSK
jgi:CDP-diacylglycerol--serine O-phosphatidyltransferase